MRSWLLVILASACWSERAPARTTPDSAPVSTPPAWTFPGSGIRFASRETNRCARVIERVIAQSRDDMTRGGLPAEMMDEIQEQATASCQTLEWSSEVLDCWERATSQSHIGECYSTLTPEQQRDFTDRVTEAMQRRTRTLTTP